MFLRNRIGPSKKGRFVLDGYLSQQAIELIISQNAGQLYLFADSFTPVPRVQSEGSAAALGRGVAMLGTHQLGEGYFLAFFDAQVLVEETAMGRLNVDTHRLISAFRPILRPPLALRCSLSPMAIACFRLLTIGPFLLPLCSVPAENSPIVAFIPGIGTPCCSI